jgi:hypothetical protein
MSKDERVETVAKSLGMDPVPESMERLRKEIRAELRDLHPDRNAGDFADTGARERFNQLSTALAQIDSDTGATSLVPLATVAPMVGAIIEALGQAGQLEAREPSPAAQRQALRVEARDEARHRFRLSRLGSGSVAAVLSTLWALPPLTSAFGNEGASDALQASILGPLFAHPLSEPILFGMALYAWLFFALTWFMEQNDLSRIDWVTTDEARGLLLRRAVLAARQRGDADTITKADVRSALGRGLRPTLALRLLGARDVSASFLDGVTNQHVAELTAQGVLTHTGDVELSPRYLVDENVAKDLKP